MQSEKNCQNKKLYKICINENNVAKYLIRTFLTENVQ